MEIVKIELKKLNPAEYNPRKRMKKGSREYEELRKSIDVFGLVDPIVWNKRTGNIVGGHQRYYVLCDMGKTETYVSVVDLGPDEERALNVALNKISGSWDNEKLVELLDSFDESMLSLSGYTADELDDMMQSLSPLDLDDEIAQYNQDDKELHTCHCPKCGFEFAI